MKESVGEEEDQKANHGMGPEFVRQPNMGRLAQKSTADLGKPPVFQLGFF